MSLFALPNELLLSVTDNLFQERDINAMVQTCQRLYSLLSSYLYQRNFEKNGSSALFWAVQHGKIATAQRFLDAGGNPHVRKIWKDNAPLLSPFILSPNFGYRAGDLDWNGTPLHWAARHGHLQIATLLIEHGAKVEAEDNSLRTPIQWAIESRQERVMRLLIREGARYDGAWSEEIYGSSTALHVASYYGYPEIAHLLLNLGADAEARNTDGETPLHWATCNEQRYFAWCSIALMPKILRSNDLVKTIHLLLDHKPDPRSRDLTGSSPMDHSKGHSEKIMRDVFDEHYKACPGEGRH